MIKLWVVLELLQEVFFMISSVGPTLVTPQMSSYSAEYKADE